MPPLHLAVREGHADVVHFLLEQGAARGAYSGYPFKDDFITIATDRGHTEIARLLAEMPDPLALKGEVRPVRDNGEIDFQRDDESMRFQKLVNDEKVRDAERMLEVRPDLALDEAAFWGEGTACMPSVLPVGQEMLELSIIRRPRARRRRGGRVHFGHLIRWLISSAGGATTMPPDDDPHFRVPRRWTRRLLLEHGANMVRSTSFARHRSAAARWGSARLRSAA